MERGEHPIGEFVAHLHGGEKEPPLPPMDGIEFVDEQERDAAQEQGL